MSVSFATESLQFLNDRCHLGVVGHLSVFVPAHLDRVYAETRSVSSEESGDEDTGPHLPFEVPLDFKHAPVGLYCNRS